MSDRYPGGIITKTPVTPAGPYAEGSAPGVWTLEQQAYWQAQGVWPNASNPTPNDPYFQYVTSLLHGDGTNGGQNNTFLDSSTNAFTITRNGNTTQGSFSPYGSNWGNYFNGSSYLSVPTNTVFNFSTGDFTIEAWFSTTVLTSYQTITASSDGTNYWFIKTNSNGTLTCSINGSEFSSNAYVCDGQWHHVAMVRSGSTVTLYVDGISNSYISYSSSVGTSAAVTAGYYVALYPRYLTGYISNLRITKGGALYTNNFTPGTAPLTTTVSSGTVSWLTCQSNRFIDNSVNAFAITIGGTPQVTRFSPFAPTYATQYSASTIGGSGYFDGSGDYLTCANNAAFQLVGSDFTVEAWIYVTGGSGGYPIVSHSNYPGAWGSGWAFALDSNRNLVFYNFNNDFDGLTGATVVPLNTWTHVAVSRSGSTVKLWVNGVQDASSTNQPFVNATQSLYIGATISGQNWNATRYFNGYIEDIRIVKGTAVYTSAFTPPTAPLTAISGTSLLTNFTNGAIYDNAEVADYETVNGAQISTSVKKYGTGSLAFDGTGDYLSTPNASNFNFGTGNFTVEMWIYLTTEGSDQFFAGGDTNGNWNCGFLTSDKTIRFGRINTAWDATSTPVSVVNTWNHVVFCRAGGYLKIFFNGTQVYGGSNTQDYNITNTLIVASDRGTGRYVNGYIDDFRITKGYARYWENFTPPSAALPNFGGAYQVPTQDPQFNYTTLLLPGNGTNGAQNNTFLDSSTNAFTITRNGNTTQGTFTPFSQTGWGNYFDGSGDYLATPSNAAFAFGTGDYTIETWVYPQQFANQQIFNFSDDADNLSLDPAGTLTFYDGSIYTTGATYVLNQWQHIAYTRSSGTVRIFLNGTLIKSFSSSYNSGTRTAYFGARGIPTAGTNCLLGYMSNIRIVKGTAVYTSNFTPSTTPLTAVSGTSVLTAQSNRFIDNSTNAFTLTVNGNTSVQAFSPFAPTAAYSASTVGGSGYFDGTGDYLSVADNAAFDVGSSDFTVECWVYSDFSGAPGIFGQWNSGGYAPISGAINSSYVYFTASSDGSNWDLVGTASSARMYNAWTHVAWVRYGNEWSIYVNGVKNIVSASQSFTPYNSTDPMVLGARYNGSNPLNGNISGFRFVKGTAVYTTTFTPPTAPPTAITNTSLLCNFTNAGITDATAKNDLETVGNAQISTTQSKFGGSSIAFDGTGDYLIAPSSPNYDFGTGDFTIEGWAYVSSKNNAVLLQRRNTAGTGYIYFIGWDGTTLRVFYNGGSYFDPTDTFTTNTWTHFALTRFGTTLALYVNGVMVGSATDSSSWSSDKPIYIGALYNGNYPLNGYMQDVRITKGYARYVQPFTPPAQADQLY